MLDSNIALESKIKFYNQPEYLDNPFHPAGFRGTWNFSDHKRIPDVFFSFLQLYFGVLKIRRIPLEDINKLLNDLWDGPGSLEKIFRLEGEMRASGKSIKILPTDIEKKLVVDDDDDDGLPDLPLANWGSEDDLEISDSEEN